MIKLIIMHSERGNRAVQVRCVQQTHQRVCVSMQPVRFPNASVLLQANRGNEDGDASASGTHPQASTTRQGFVGWCSLRGVQEETERADVQLQRVRVPRARGVREGGDERAA